MEFDEGSRRGTDEPFLSLMAIGGSAILKLLGVSAEDAENYHFRAVVLKEKRLEPDIEGIPILEGHDHKAYIEFQGYREKFVRYNLMAKVMMGCQHDDYEGRVIAGIIYTDAAYKKAALPINAFKWTSADIASESFIEIVLTDYSEEQLKMIDPRLVVLAPFTVSTHADRVELRRRSRLWKEEIEIVYPSDLHKAALDVIGLLILNRFRDITREEVIAMLGFDLLETKAGREIYDEGLASGIEKGIKKGMLDEAKEMVIDNLEEHFSIVPPTIIEKINAIARIELLKTLHKKAIKCQNIQEFQKILEQMG